MGGLRAADIGPNGSKSWKERLWRRQRLHELALPNYDAYLETPHWRSFRKVIFQKRHARCQQCGTSDNLHLHHLTYERLGAERETDVMILCESCHDKTHGRDAASLVRHYSPERADQ